jgi:transposase
VEPDEPVNKSASVVKVVAASELSEVSREELIAIILAQRETIARLEKRVADLEKQLGLGGPDPPPRVVKPNAALRARKERKRRSQHFSRQREQPTQTVEHYPQACPDCGRSLRGGGPFRSRQILDIDPSPVKVTEHVIHARWCGVCRKRVLARPDLSGLVSGRRRIGHNLASWIADLHINARIPLRTIQDIVRRLYSVHISTGEMTDLMALIAKKGEPALEAIKQEIRSSAYKHADETGWREEGQYKCLWSVSTALSRWFHIDPHRSSDVIMRLLGSEMKGILVTDFYYAYNKVPGAHQRCWAHFKRALDALRLQHPDNPALHGWIDEVISIWREAREYRAFCLTGPLFGAGVFDRRRKRKELDRKLYALAEPFLDADSEVFPQATLARRIAMFYSELFTFVEFPEVPDDNNAAERAIRPAVILRKVCGGTRSEKGTTVKAQLMSLFGTWRIQGKDPIQQCRALLTASP